MQDPKQIPNNRFLVKNDDFNEIESYYDQSYPADESDYSQTYYGDREYGSEKQQVFNIFKVLRNHWLMILIINLLITSLAVVYEAQKPDYYVAGTRVQIDNEINPAQVTVIVANPGNDPTYFTTQLQILEGSGLLRRVVKSIDLENNPGFLKPSKTQKLTVWQNVLRMFNLYRPQPEDDNKEVIAKDKTAKPELNLKKASDIDSEEEIEALAPYVRYLQGRLKISPVKDGRTAIKETRLIDIEFTHNDPVVAAKLVNAVADTYVLQNLEQRVQTNADAGDFLQKRVAELQSLIRTGEEKLINYGKSHQILSLDPGQNTVVQRLADLNAKLGQAENDRILAQAAYQAALQNPLAGTTAEKNDSRTSSLEGQLLTLRQQLAQLKTEYTDDWPDVIKLRKQIEDLEKELQASRKTASSTQLATLEQTYRQAVARENELRSNFDKQRSEVLSQNEAAINYKIIQQEIATNKTLLDGVLQRSKETDIIMTGTKNNVRVVDRSLVPSFPAGPQRSRNIIIAFLVSLMLGVGLAFLRDWINDTVTNAETLELDTGLPVLGLIPAPSTGFVGSLVPKSIIRFKEKRSRGNNYHLERFEQPVISEAYLHLRTYLLLSTAGGPPQTILVTSGQPGEGKTVTAVNVAKCLAETGAKVLLVDADLRYPRLHLVNDISNNTGLSNLLTVKNLTEDLLNQGIQKEVKKNLDILTAGSNVPNPVNIIGSKEMKQLNELLKAKYDHIVIDSPPVLYFADSSILSTMSDVVLLIARHNLSTKRSILHAKKKLQDVSAKIIGIVFNGVPLSGVTYNNYGYYKQLDSSPTDEDGALHLN